MFLPTFERRALWQAVSTRGSPPAPRFGKLPEFGASPSTWNGSQTAQLFYQGESWSFEPQMAVQPDEQAKPSFRSPESLPVPDAAGRAQARLPPPCSGSIPGNLLLCPWQDRAAHSLHRDTFGSSLDLLPFFFLLSFLF